MTRWLVGIDAGGTGARAMLLDLQTGETVRSDGPPANWTVQGPDHCRHVIEGLLADLLPDEQQPDGMVTGIAGFYPPDHQEKVDQWKRRLWPGSDWRVVGDVIVAWAGAHAAEHGIVLVSGTGSICYGRNSLGEEARAGGWGPLFGDVGSGYNMGLECLRALANFVDGIGPPTELSEKVMKRWPDQGKDLTGWLRGIYRNKWDRTRIAGLSRLVVEAAEQGDSVANSLVLRAAAELLTLAGAVSSRLGDEVQPLSLLGGLGTSDVLLRAFASLAGLSRAQVRLSRPQLEPVQGAVLMAAESVGGRKLLRQAREMLMAPDRALSVSSAQN